LHLFAGICKKPQEGLDEALADQVKAEPRLLPLLEFALDELYKQRSTGGLLSFEAYRVYLDGSIVRALAKRADATLEGLPQMPRDVFRSVMRRLATTVDDAVARSTNGPQMDVIEKGSSGPTFQRQRVPYDQPAVYPPGAKALVDAFVAARLLVVETGKADEQKAEVTVAHEALFEHWAALKNLLLAERYDLILPRARVAAAHESWRAENRAMDFLLPPGKRLSEAEQLLAEYGEELTPELKAYVAASMARAHAQQKRRQRLLVGALLAFALLAAAAGVTAVSAFKAKQTANEQKAEAEKQTEVAINEKKKANEAASQAHVSLARYSQDAGNTPQALAHLARALRLNQRNYGAAALMGAMLTQISWPLPIASPMRHDSAINSAQFSPDGQRVVTASADYTARLWDALSGKPIGEPMRHEGGVIAGAVTSAQFSPDGQRVVTTSADKTARLWDALSGRPLGEPMRHDTGVDSAQFSPDGQRVLTGSADAARVWDAASGGQIGEPMRHKARVNFAQFSPDGLRVVTTSADKTARLWDALSGKPLGEPMQHRDRVSSAQFSPDGQRVLTASWDKTARLWDIPTISSKDDPEDVLLLADLAEAMGGVVLQTVDQTEILNILTPEQIRETLSKIADKFPMPSSQLSSLQRFLKWSVSERRSRTISPFSDLTVAEWVENRINEGALDGLRAALRMDPPNARLAAHLGRILANYAHDALAKATDADEVRRAREEADFQTRRALKLAPDNGEVKALRSEVMTRLQTIPGPTLRDRSSGP
jgi:dipeptidyl aminopeptidase/acylaminoacyl peptidase